MITLWNTQRADKYGLYNQGATCYLNSVLQVLYMTEDFRAAVESFTRDHSYTEHIDHELHKLFCILKTETAQTNGVSEKLRIDRVNVQQDAAEYFEKILRLTSGTASKVFHGELTHTTTCSHCRTETPNSEAFWHLPIPLVDSGCEHYSVEAGVEHHFRASALTGANQMYCDHCDEKRDATVGCVMQHYPDVLMLLLKRFMVDYSSWTTVKNNFDVDIPCTLQIPNDEQNQVYELYAIVDHFGGLRSGHYSARIKDDKGWYNFDDSSVTLLQPLFQDKDFVRSNSAYLLFYKKTNERRNTQDGVVGEDAEDHIALTELEEPGTGFPIPGQHALPDAQAEQNPGSDRQCRLYNLPTSDLNDDCSTGQSNIDKQGDEQDCGVTTYNLEEYVGQQLVGVERTSQRAVQTKQSLESDTGTVEGQQRVITEDATLCYKRKGITSIENIIKTTENHRFAFIYGSEDRETGTTVVFLIQGLRRTSDNLSAFTLEQPDILMEVQLAAQFDNCDVLVCSGPVSAIKRIGRSTSMSQQDLMHKIFLAVRDVKITPMWVPAHLGILGKAAGKRVIEKSVISLFKSEGQIILLPLQWHWELDSKDRHLFPVSSRVTESVNVCRSRGGRRKEKVAIFTLRMGPTFLESTLKHHDGLCSEFQEEEEEEEEV